MEFWIKNGGVILGTLTGVYLIFKHYHEATHKKWFSLIAIFFAFGGAGIMAYNNHVNSVEKEGLKKEIQILSNRMGSRILKGSELNDLAGFFSRNENVEVSITCVENDAESCRFAEQIVKASNVKRSKMLVAKPEGYLETVRDILIVSHKEKTKMLSEELCGILASFECVTRMENPGLGNDIVIIVGSN